MWAILKSRLASGRRRSAMAAGFARRDDGAAALEFAIVAAPFIALLLATVQTTLAFFAGQVLESAVADSSRAILTGSAQNASLSQSAFAAAVCAASKTALFDCSKLMVDVQTANSFGAANTSMPTLTFDSHGNVNNAWQFQPGHFLDPAGWEMISPQVFPTEQLSAYRRAANAHIAAIPAKTPVLP